MPACYCDQSARAFRDWLRARYGSLGDLNTAWGTAFWGQRYGTWDEIDVPRRAPTTVNPALRLDFMRFSSDAFLVNWQRRNIAKRPGEMRRNSLAHLACGADGILSYQWRASRSGAGSGG